MIGPAARMGRGCFYPTDAMTKPCIICGELIVDAKGSTKTHPGECREIFMRQIHRDKSRRYRANPAKREVANARKRGTASRTNVRRREKRRVKAGLDHCLVCNKAFRPRTNKITCSPACREKWKRHMRHLKNHPVTERRAKGIRCPVCKVLFCPLGRGRRKTCSEDCSVALHRIRIVKWLPGAIKRRRDAKWAETAQKLSSKT